jgi:NADPH:quinone reductase-like Zn-dependent oxidoreductase
LDTAGAETFAHSLRAVRHGGTVFAIGFLSGAVVSVELMQMIVKSVRILGNNTGSALDLAAAVSAIEAARIQPIVDRTYSIGALPDAYAAMAKGGGYFGKLALRLDWAR